MGTPTRLVADVGDDDLGEMLVGLLDRAGATTSGITRRPGRSTSYSIVVEPPGSARERSFWHHVGANADFDGSSLDLGGAGLLHLGYPSLLPALWSDAGARWIALLGQARAHGCVTSLDLATVDPASPAAGVPWRELLARVLPLTDIVTPSTDDVATALGTAAATDADAALEVAHGLVDLGAAVVMLTAGAHGLFLVTAPAHRLEAAGLALSEQALAWADRELWMPSVAGPVRTTTGAGDAAAAGLLRAVLDGCTPEEAAQAASNAAAARMAGLPFGATEQTTREARC
jgi:sugar/nucleoside kinase (ribokinase family)